MDPAFDAAFGSVSGGQPENMPIPMLSPAKTVPEGTPQKDTQLPRIVWSGKASSGDQAHDAADQKGNSDARVTSSSTRRFRKAPHLWDGMTIGCQSAAPSTVASISTLVALFRILGPLAFWRDVPCDLWRSCYPLSVDASAFG